jgi:hypothetical protein
MRILSMGLLLAAVTAGSVSAQARVNASILPSARSTTVGQPATAFATIINSGDAEATNCRLALLNPSVGNTINTDLINASFSYQTTTPANALSGTPNTPVSIAAGATQNFIFSLTPNGVFTETAAVIDFVCDNGIRATYRPGLTTFNLSSDANAPDILAIGSTLSNDGIAIVATPTGRIPFALSAVNIGSGDPAPDGPSSPSAGNNEATITVRPESATLALPMTFDICEANAVSVCIGPRGTTATANIGDSPSFFVVRAFAQGVGVPLFADIGRINIVFDDANGVERGRTSVATTVGGRETNPETDLMPSGIWWFDVDGSAIEHGEIVQGRVIVDANGNMTAYSPHTRYGQRDLNYGFAGQLTTIDNAASPQPSASGSVLEVISDAAYSGNSTLNGRWRPEMFMVMLLAPPAASGDVSGPSLLTTNRRFRALYNLTTKETVNNVVATYNLLSREDNGSFTDIGDVSIDAQGNLSGFVALGGQCPVTGQFVQVGTTENIFRLTFNTGAGCDAANIAAVGHGFQFSTTNVTDGLQWFFGSSTASTSALTLVRQPAG